MTVTPTAPPTTEGQPPPVELTPDAGAILLRLARAVVAATASHRLRPADFSSLLPPDPPMILFVPSAAFVTLHRGVALRGCVGSLADDVPLWETVVSAAVNAASHDLRFDPVTDREVPFLSIDVSVLGPAVPLRDLTDFRPGIHGVIVERCGRRGLLLPEVAADQDWGVCTMLEMTCRKAGLAPDAWRAAGTHILIFRTARVGDTGRPSPVSGSSRNHR